MPHDRSYDAFFTAGWATTYMVFDEDDDDHRWERVEMYYPMHGFGGPEDIDIWSVKKWRDGPSGNYARLYMADAGEKPGLGGHPQADSLGDRGEFDRDNSGGGKLYVGVFDRKLHLAGAEWGAWAVDKNGEFHGGWKTPSPKPLATQGRGGRPLHGHRRQRVPRHGRVRLRRRSHVRLPGVAARLQDAGRARPDEAPLIDTRAAGWQGAARRLHEAGEPVVAGGAGGLPGGVEAGPDDARDGQAGQRRRRWRSATRTRYWIKEKAFREIRARLKRGARGRAVAGRHARRPREGPDVRLYYLGRFDEYVARIAAVPGA